MREVLDEELGLVLERLLVERVQHRVAGAVRGGAGALRDALAVMRGHAAERTLVDPAVLGARERHAVVLELDDRGRRFLAHVLDRVLVAEPVGALDGVVEVPAPVVLAHVAERGADAALRRDGVAAGREHLGDAGGRQARLGQAQGGAQAGAAGADHDHVVAVIDERVAALMRSAPETRCCRPRTRRRRRASACTNVDSSSVTTLTPAVHVVLDHDLHAEARVPAQRQDQQQSEHRRPAARAASAHGRVVQRGNPSSANRNHSVSGTSATAVTRCSHQWPTPSFAAPGPARGPAACAGS